MHQRFRVAFLGRGELGMGVLTQLLRDPVIDVVAILTCSPSPEHSYSVSDFEQVAHHYKVPFVYTENVNTPESYQFLASLKLDLAVGLLWKHTISEAVVSVCGSGIVNFHGGDLPKYRGNACQTWAILNGESQIGATCHLMQGDVLDSGPILAKEMIPVTASTTVGDLISTVNKIGIELVPIACREFLQGKITPKPQDLRDSLYCYPRLPRDGEICWSNSATSIETLVRAAGRPYPGAYSWYQDVRDNGRLRKLQIWKVGVRENPIGKFVAVAGHVLKLPENKRAVVAGDGQLVVLEEVHRDGLPIEPHEAFRTVRQRLGLDYGTLLEYILSHQK